MKNIYTRKIILSSCIVFLLCVLIVQTVLSKKTSVRDMVLESNIDKITVQNVNSTIELTYSNEEWYAGYVGDKTYIAAKGLVENLISDIKNVKLLSVATRSVGSDAQRYGLNDNSKIIVKAYLDGKELRTIYIGKTSATNSQNYIQIDEDQAVYIVGSNMHSVFDTTVEDLRSKVVYYLSASDIEKVSVTTGSDSYSIQKSEDSDGKAVWGLVQGELSFGNELDNDKISSWINSLGQLTVSSWLDAGVRAPVLESSLSMIAAGKKYEVTLYSTTSETDDGEDETTYIAACNQTPYSFKVDKYSAQKIKKSLSELSKSSSVD